jgi:hypothetical protein
MQVTRGQLEQTDSALEARLLKCFASLGAVLPLTFRRAALDQFRTSTARDPDFAAARSHGWVRDGVEYRQAAGLVISTKAAGSPERGTRAVEALPPAAK